MQQQSEARCSEMNMAVKSCTTYKCTQPAIMCDETHCQCRKRHQNCLNSTQLQSVYSKLKKKDQSGNQPIKILIGCCDYSIKKFEIQKALLQKLQEQGGALDNQEQAQLYKTLKGNKKIMINGDTMSRVTQSLISQPQLSDSSLNSMIENTCDSLKSYVDEILRSMNSTIKQQFKKQAKSVSSISSGIIRVDSLQQSDKILRQLSTKKDQHLKGITQSEPIKMKPMFILSKKLKYKKIDIKNFNRASFIDEQAGSLGSMIIDLMNSGEPKKNAFLLLQPCLNSLQIDQSSVRFKVLNNTVYFGVSFRQTVQERQFYCSAIDRYQGYSFNNSGIGFSTNPDDNKKKTNFIGFAEGDTVHLTYSSRHNKFRIINISQKSEHTMKAPNIHGRSMHFSVGFGHGGSIQLMKDA